MLTKANLYQGILHCSDGGMLGTGKFCVQLAWNTTQKRNFLIGGLREGLVKWRYYFVSA